MTNRTECVVREGKFVDVCAPLSECSSGSNPVGNAKGIFAWAWSNVEGPTRTMYGIRGGQHPKGMLFNFCPFCGKALDAPFTKEPKP